MYEHDRANIESDIRKHLSVFQDLADQSARYLSGHNYEKAAVYAQLAAHYASYNHTGLFASSQIENILLAIGHELPRLTSNREDRLTAPTSPKSVLHVLTEAASIGGHTRLVRRWIDQDPDRTHSVAMTRQGRRPLPKAIKTAVASARGIIYTLDASPGGLLTRAKALREIAKSFDQVVLHTNPYDVVPIIALAEKSSRVIFMNHADHVFWLGIGVSDVVAHFREGSLSLSQERRGIQPKRCSLLPLPLELNPTNPTRAEAKKLLGIDETEIVLLSVGSAYKYRRINGVSFVDALMPVLLKHEKATLLVVGPDNCSDSGKWAQGDQLTGGRIKAFGIQEDPAVFYQAADIYLDSFPMTSLTALLDGAIHGMPLVRYHIFSGAASLLRGDDVALTGEMINFDDLNLYQEEVSRLIQDPKLRTERGENVRTKVSDVHLSPGWNGFLEKLYLQAANMSPIAALDQAKENGVTDFDVALSWLHLNTGISQGIDATLREHSRLLPLRPRVKVWAKMCREKHRPLPFFLLSESVGTRVERQIWRHRDA
jgi:hypothetical protein